MAKYIMRERPDLDGSGRQMRYPYMLIERMVTTDYIARQIEQATSFTIGDVKGIIAAIQGVIARSVAEGCSVDLEGIGTFRGGLRLREGLGYEEEQSPQRRSAHGLTIGRVHFRPAKELLHETNKHCFLRRTKGRSTHSPYSRSERIALASEYLRRQHFMLRHHYASLTGLSESTAGRELKALVAEGTLVVEGRRGHRRYLLPESLLSRRSDVELS